MPADVPGISSEIIENPNVAPDGAAHDRKMASVGRGQAVDEGIARLLPQRRRVTAGIHVQQN